MIREIPMIPPKPWPPGPEVIMPQAWGSVGKLRGGLESLPGGCGEGVVRSRRLCSLCTGMLGLLST